MPRSRSRGAFAPLAGEPLSRRGGPDVSNRGISTELGLKATLVGWPGRIALLGKGPGSPNINTGPRQAAHPTGFGRCRRQPIPAFTCRRQDRVEQERSWTGSLVQERQARPGRIPDGSRSAAPGTRSARQTARNAILSARRPPPRGRSAPARPGGTGTRTTTSLWASCGG